jgi:tRNA pseudouridine32 synthase/23S rRNA pseudouridine746 synthase
MTRSAAVLVALAATNVLAQRSRLPADLVVPVGIAALVAGARVSGLGWDEMGLDGAALRRGLPVAATAASLTAAGVVAAAAHPWTPDVRDPVRYPTPAVARRAVFGTIPLSVALPEEVAFRGVLDASLRRHLSPRAADFAGAVAFGAWHVLGARPVGPGPGGRALGVAATVAATALAGHGFTALRQRADSVLPAVAVHWALNGAAATAAGGA